jgi:hypothetical protein
MIHQGEFDAISVLSVDNVALHGNAILSVLRTTCGQSDIDECGQDLGKPKMTYFRFSRLGYALLVAAYIVALGWIGAAIAIAIQDGSKNPHPRILWAVCYRIKQRFGKTKVQNDKLSEMASSRREELLPPTGTSS